MPPAAGRRIGTTCSNVYPMIPISTELEPLKSPMRILHLEDSAADHALVRLTLRRSGVAHEIRQVETLDEFT